MSSTVTPSARACRERLEHEVDEPGASPSDISSAMRSFGGTRRARGRARASAARHRRACPPAGAGVPRAPGRARARVRAPRRGRLAARRSEAATRRLSITERCGKIARSSGTYATPRRLICDVDRPVTSSPAMRTRPGGGRDPARDRGSERRLPRTVRRRAPRGPARRPLRGRHRRARVPRRTATSRSLDGEDRCGRRRASSVVALSASDGRRTEVCGLHLGALSDLRRVRPARSPCRSRGR